MCSQYGELWPLTAEICWRVWGIPANFNGYRILLSLLANVAQRRLTKHCTMFGRLLCWYIIYTFWGLLPLKEFCQLQNSLCIQVLLSPILIAFLHGTRVAAVSQTLWHSTRNGITEISQTVPPVFGWVNITLGIGPQAAHSSYTLAQSDGCPAEYRWCPLRKFRNSIPCMTPQTFTDAHRPSAVQ